MVYRQLAALFVLLISSTYSLNRDENSGLSPEEKFMDFFPLTMENFTENVMKNEDPWVIIFHDGAISRSWKKMAVGTRGLVWMGMIDTTVDHDFLKKIKYDQKVDGEGRVYPFGSPKTKKQNWKPAKNPGEARKIAVDSIPDHTVALKGKDVEDFLYESFSSVPSKFPVILFTDEDETPSLFKALANRFKQYYHFGRFIRPTVEDYRSLGIGLADDTFDMPTLMVLVPKDTKSGEVSINVVQYQPKKMGPMNYPNIMKFLFGVNNQFRYLLLGNSKANVKETAEMEDIIQIESRRFDMMVGAKNYGTNDNEKVKDFKPIQEEVVMEPEIKWFTKKEEF